MFPMKCPQMYRELPVLKITEHFCIQDYDYELTLTAFCPPLHRPCAMVVPDFELICEIMLVAEGFINARVLARKFITLYTLCKELLSKQVLTAFFGVTHRTKPEPFPLQSWITDTMFFLFLRLLIEAQELNKMSG